MIWEVSGLKDELTNFKLEVQGMKQESTRQNVLGFIESDKADQEKRANNVKIFGVIEKEGESDSDLRDAIKKVAQVMNAPLNENFTAYRLGKKTGIKNRPVLVKISSGKEKAVIMASKKKLKDNQAIKDDERYSDKVMVLEDLTDARLKLLKTVRELPGTDFAFVKDGYIMVRQRTGKFVKIESADDLFHLGLDDVKYENYYRMK